MLAVLVFGGCADGTGANEAVVQSSPAPVATASSDAPSPTSAEEPVAPNDEASGEDEAVAKYMSGLASNRSDTARAALEHAAEGSVAQLYLEHQSNMFEAALDGGLREEESLINEIDGGRQGI